MYYELSTRLSKEELGVLAHKMKINKNKLTNADIDILVMLVEDKLKDIYNGPEGVEVYSKPEIFRKLLSKLETMYFEGKDK